MGDGAWIGAPEDAEAARSSDDPFNRHAYAKRWSIAGATPALDAERGRRRGRPVPKGSTDAVDTCPALARGR